MTEAPLRQPKLEPAAAENALASMKAARNIDEFETAWRLFLNSIEKSWQKAERCCQHVRSTFEPWQGEYHRLRKKNMLLRYLKQARNADNHSIQNVTPR